MLRKITEITRAQGLALIGCDITAYADDDSVFFSGPVFSVTWDCDSDPCVQSGRNRVYLNLDDGYYILADVPDNWDDLTSEDAPQSAETPPKDETPEQRVERLRAELAAAEKALRGGLPDDWRWSSYIPEREPCCEGDSLRINWDDDYHTHVFVIDDDGDHWVSIPKQALFAWVDRVRSRP